MNRRDLHPIAFFNDWFVEPFDVRDYSVAGIVDALNRHPIAADPSAQDYVMPQRRCREHAGRFRIYGENQDVYYCFVYEGDDSFINRLGRDFPAGYTCYLSDSAICIPDWGAAFLTARSRESFMTRYSPHVSREWA